MEKFAERLKELREQKGLSIQQLSKEIKLSSSSLSRWENKQVSVKINEIIIIAKYFGVTTDYLLGLED